MVFLKQEERALLKIVSIDKSLLKHTLKFIKFKTSITEGHLHGEKQLKTYNSTFSLWQVLKKNVL